MHVILLIKIFSFCHHFVVESLIFALFFFFFFQAFWEWSWDELVAYDLPATYQYVHDQAGQKLHYVGHSLVNFTTLQFCNFCYVLGLYYEDVIDMSCNN